MELVHLHKRLDCLRQRPLGETLNQLVAEKPLRFALRERARPVLAGDTHLVKSLRPIGVLANGEPQTADRLLRFVPAVRIKRDRVASLGEVRP